MRLMAVFLLLPLLSGCLTNSKPVEQMSYTEASALAGQIENRCIEQGVPRNSPNFSQCAQQEARREVSTRREMQARRNSGVICNQVGTAMVCN